MFTQNEHSQIRISGKWNTPTIQKNCSPFQFSPNVLSMFDETHWLIPNPIFLSHLLNLPMSIINPWALNNEYAVLIIRSDFVIINSTIFLSKFIELFGGGKCIIHQVPKNKFYKSTFLKFSALRLTRKEYTAERIIW